MLQFTTLLDGLFRGVGKVLDEIQAPHVTLTFVTYNSLIDSFARIMRWMWHFWFYVSWKMLVFIQKYLHTPPSLMDYLKMTILIYSAMDLFHSLP